MCIRDRYLAGYVGGSSKDKSEKKGGEILEMKVTDYIVEFLQRKGIHDFFGYQGTMIAHLVDSIEKNPHTRSHSSYHEQGAAFAACGYAQAGERCACALSLIHI